MKSNINNLNHKRIMKKFYNNFIMYSVDSILVIPLLVLIIVNYAFRIMSILLKAIRKIMVRLIALVKDVRDDLIEVLSIKD